MIITFSKSWLFLLNYNQSIIVSINYLIRKIWPWLKPKKNLNKKTVFFFLSDEGPTLEMFDFIIHIDSTARLFI